MKKIITLIFLFICVTLSAQQEAANWYFGYGAGMQFDQATGNVNVVNDGELSTNEGCSTISDSNGNLLFYSDGTTVWNRNHNIMQNGNGLYGDSSSTQSAIIVPKPDDINIYYVFTVDNAVDGNDYGLNYSEIDMTLDGGLGAVAVTTKNINLLPICSEKISAVLKDCITESIWVITFASQTGSTGSYDTFHAFEVNNSGVNTTATVSTFNLNIDDKRGYLKLSPDGTKLANANMSDGLFLYDFDVATGIVSNEQQLFINTQSDSPYGVEFSQSNQFLYVHSSNDYYSQNFNENNDPENHSSTLTQFDLTVASVQASEYTIEQRQLYRGGLQLAPDGKIYRALSATYDQGLPFLGVINNPNDLGPSTNYQHNAVNLSPNTSSQGLPPFIQSLFNIQIDIIQNGLSAVNLNLCDGDLYTLVSENIPGATYTWTLDNNPLPETGFDLVDIDQAGHYQVLIDPNNGDCAIEGQAYVTYYNLPMVFNQTLFQCDEDGTPDGITIFNLTEANDDLTGGAANTSVKFYETLVDAENSSSEIDGNSFLSSNGQNVYAQVFDDSTGCFDIAELTLEVSTTNANDAVLEACDDDGTEDGLHTFNLLDAELDVLTGLPTNLEVSFYKTYDDALLEINNLTTTYTNTTPYSQIIYVRVENMNACYGINEIQLTVFELPNIEPDQDVFYCLNYYPDTITLSGGIINDSPDNYSYDWSTGETTSEIMVNEPGIYTVTVTNNNDCQKSRNITVSPSNIANIESIEVVDATDNNTVTVLVSEGSEGEFVHALGDENGPYTDFFYSDSNVFENVPAGIHTVYVKDIKNDCGTVTELVSVIGFPSFFTPNNDGHNDTWQIKGISDQFQPGTVIYIFNRYGKLLIQLNPKGFGWNGTLNGEHLPASDYWFAVTLQDGRVYKNHFSLIR